MSTTVARVRAAYARIDAVDRPEIWIDLRPRAEVEAEARAVDARVAAGERLPLAGRLLAAKGNIDVAGLPTTAGCPAYAYTPEADAPAVARLKAAGALVLGTTNLDQFATGLVGTRSPHGAVRNAHDPTRISGGSSSGSAVAVALGIVDLALGTDTAGSGRVPAAFNGIVGLKPTRGLVPTAGVVPACASLDCVTAFARTLPEAEQALSFMTSPPDRDLPPLPQRAPGPWRIAVPSREQLGELDEGWAEAYEAAVSRLRKAGADIRTLDLTPFTEAAAMLYEGAFVAERYTAVGSFIDKLLTGGSASPSDLDPTAPGLDSTAAGLNPTAPGLDPTVPGLDPTPPGLDPTPPGLDPTVAGIITRARDIPAHRLYADQDRLAALRSHAEAELADADALLLPTTPGHPTLAEVAADPLGSNARLGRFTNSTNLFDQAAVAVPAGEVNGLPFGVMLIGPAFTDDRLARIAGLLPAETRLAVVGAHLTGQPLNPQLLALGAQFERTTTTAATYRLHALSTTPPKPGLVRVSEGGSAIEAEVWRLPAEGLGRLLATLPRPMTLGSVELADGSQVPGFLCEPAALTNADDITAYGGWRSYLSAE